MPRGGQPNQAGIGYQNYIGVYRLLEYTNNQTLLQIEFESRDEKLEDITRYYQDYSVYEQVKWKGSNIWQRGSLRPILLKFASRFENGSKKIKFELSTNMIGNTDVQDFEAYIKELKATSNSSNLDKDKINHIVSFFNPSIDKTLIFEICRNLEFNWPFAGSNPLDPTREVREICIEELRQKCDLSREDASNAVNRLYTEVTRWSTLRTTNRCYAEEEFRQIIPICGRFEVDNLDKEIPENLLSIFLDIGFKKFLGPRIVSFGSEKVQVSGIASFNQKDILIWVLPCGVLDKRIKKVNRIVGMSKDYRHVIVLADPSIDVRLFSEDTRKYVIKSDEQEKLRGNLEALKNESREESQ
jgi:hypothetical protein